MAPLPANATGRLFVLYSANASTHRLMVRYPGTGAPPSDLLEGLDDVFTEMNAFMPTDWTFLDWWAVYLGDTVSQPVDGSPTAFAGVRPLHPKDRAAMITIPGRSTVTGKRWRFEFLGAAITETFSETTEGDWRITTAESLGVAALVAALEALGSVAIDGVEPVIKQYANIGYNKHWVAKLRRS